MPCCPRARRAGCQHKADSARAPNKGPSETSLLVEKNPCRESAYQFRFHQLPLPTWERLFNKSFAHTATSAHRPVAGLPLSVTAMGMASILKPSAWALEREDTRFGPSSSWSNKDMDPVPPHKRTWSTWNFVAYWVSDATNAAAWQLASSMLAVGLSWRQALPAIAVGHFIIAVSLLCLANFFPCSCLFAAGGYAQRDDGGSSPLGVPCYRSFILWVLVQLFRGHKPDRSGHVLVWHSGKAQSFLCRSLLTQT